MTTPAQAAATDIAIVAMAGRFPGAADVDALWRRVVAGDDCLVDLGVDELRAAGVPDQVVRAQNYVRRNGVLDDVEMFDAGFFGIGPRDAAIMDPQQRHFLECAWEALETSGHIPERFAGSIGVFGGCGMNTYLLNNLLTNPKLVDQVGMFLLRHTANDKDFLTTTVSYKLDLRGPSVNVQTACSTSLVAVHLATQSLLSMECDLALAGGATIEVPHRRGYVYQDGEILAPDGVCRAFDDRSGGTVLTSGVGVVALRRLSDALADGDPILAVIKGTAINNDGQRKVGYLAPSVDGHADVIKEALAVAGLSARDLQLFEAHGTGTAVGDPIEFAAATEAFRASTSDAQFCRIVSTKPNIGHLDTAAGVASLVKVVQALRHRTLPPLANHTAPSPLLDVEGSPFVISAEAASWPGDSPRRAGVSSLGVGGTNAHVVVEEPPERAPTPAAVPEQLLALSARDADTVTTMASRLADHLSDHRELNLADVAHTLTTGRRSFAHRRVVVATDLEAAIETLRSTDRNRVASHDIGEVPPRVVFMFPGGGAQYPGMAAGLDRRFTVFHDVLDDGFTRVREQCGLDLATLVRVDGDPEALRKPTASLPSTFLTSVALARQWMAWGVQPDSFAGHSLGEYAAAHLAGVLTLDGALELIVARATLMERATGRGTAMLAVPLPPDEVAARLHGSLAVATINATDECVVAGREQDVATLQRQLDADGLTATLIPLAAAAHSPLLDPILPEFLDVVRGVDLAPPTIAYTSNLTGGWITESQATSPEYWVDHLRNTVRFADNLATEIETGPTVFVEVGPGHALSSFARRQPVKPVAAIPALRHPSQTIDDTAAALLAVGRLWATGVDVDLDQFCGSGRRMERLPGYPFRRERHWIEPGTGRLAAPEITTAAVPEAAPAFTRIADLADEFWQPRWLERTIGTPVLEPPDGPWLVVSRGSDELVSALETQLVARGAAVRVAAAPTEDDLSAARAVVVVGTSGGFDEAARTWMDTAVAAVRTLGDAPGRVLYGAVTCGALAAEGPASRPVDALALGVAGVGGREYPAVRTTLIDTDPAGDHATTAAAVVTELFEGGDAVVAHRGGRRLVPTLERVPIGDDGSSPGFRFGGNYLVTGGLGGIGFEIARHLAQQHGANLAVVASRAVPTGAARSEWLARHGYDDPTSRRIRRLAELEAMGTKVTLVVADLADEANVTVAVEEAEARLGRLDGAVHAAGQLRDKPIALASPADLAAVIGAKARAALALRAELSRRGADLLVLISSTSTTLMAEGQSAYVAANAVLDALAGEHGGMRVVTINYGLWADAGIAATAARRARLGIEVGQPVTHPVLSELVAERDGTVRVTGTLDTQYSWLVDEHRSSDGVALLPGTGHLELFLAAMAACGNPSVVLGPVTLFEPLVVPDGSNVTVRVNLRSTENGVVADIESDGGVGSWRTHSEAAIRVVAAEDPPIIGPLDRPAAADDVDVLDRQRRQLDLGPRWNTSIDAWVADDRSGGRVRLDPMFANELDAWLAHPAVVDVATAFAVALGTRKDALYVPVGYDAIVRYGELPEAPIVRAVRVGPSNTDVLRADVILADDDGRIALQVDGITLRPLEPTALAARSTTDHIVAPDRADRHHVPPLLELALEQGIHATEGIALLERLLASGHPRLVASSLDLDDLRRATAPTAAPEVEDPTSGRSGGISDHLRTMWVDLLGVAEVGDHADFFELGGHSLIAIRLMSRIHKELGVKLQLATIFDAPTIAAQAALIADARPDLQAALRASTEPGEDAPSSGRASAVDTADRSHRSLVTISAEGDKAPLFIVHGAGGNVLFLWSLARAMAGDRPIYGFQARGVDSADMPDPTVEEMAARYVAELRAAHRGPYLLGGYSGGGNVTFEMVRQLQLLGEEVRFLVLFDSVPPGRAGPSTGDTVRNVAAHLRREGWSKVRPYVTHRMKELVKRFVPANAWRETQRATEEAELGLAETELGYVNLYYYFSAVVERYQIAPVDVDAAVFKAEWVWPSQPYDYHWARYIRGDLDIVEVPGDHNAMFYPENAPRLATALIDVLNRRRL
jgi:acyl transferase domain-containing protein/thioesterase domain-containing protein